MTKWSVAPEPKHLSLAREPKGLSVNDVHNVVVACYKARKIQEHTTHGILVKEICLKAVMTRPWHSVQLSTGYYAVSQNTSPGAVVVVNGDGQELLRYNGDKGVLGYPTSLAVRKIITRESKIDVIHVADSANDRILSMKIKKNSPSYDHHHEGNFTASSSVELISVEEMALPVKVVVCRPTGLYQDESRDRLYVGEYYEKSRVLVVETVKL